MVTLHLRGTVSTRDFVAKVQALLDARGPDGNLRLLLDWSGIERWGFEDWSELSALSCEAAAGRIAGTAILHPSAWKRQAALLAAILRRENVLVRSWKPAGIDDAIRWLENAK